MYHSWLRDILIPGRFRDQFRKEELQKVDHINEMLRYSDNDTFCGQLQNLINSGEVQCFKTAIEKFIMDNDPEMEFTNES